MTDLEQYILDEWTEDYREGRVARREFLRRIVVFSGGAAAGLAVLKGLGVSAGMEEVAAAPPENTTIRRRNSLRATRPSR